jgi:hypothetical protein
MEKTMNGKFSIAAAAGLFLATAPLAHAVSFTSDPIATLNEQQKLGPGSHSVRVGNQTYTWRGSPPDYLHYYYHHYYDRSRYHRHWR